MSSRYAVNASATFFGRVVEETFTRGAPMEIGHTPALAVPVPEGQPYLARVWWSDKRTAHVRDGRGVEHVLTADGRVTIAAGPVILKLEMVEHTGLRRTEDVGWRLSLAWLAIFLCLTVLTQQATAVWDARCQLYASFAETFPALEARIHDRMVREPWLAACFPQAAASSGVTGLYTAEYLARLLREDYAGSEDGALQLDRPEIQAQQESFYMPAGDDGPITEMGGAADTAPDPIRTPDDGQTDEASGPPERKEDQVEVIAAESGHPVPNAVPEVEDGVAEADGGDEEVERALDAPAEEQEGWGLQDWMDASDRTAQEIEIELMLRYSRERLRIDPNDLTALNILSYYQYLAEDFEAAVATYDRIIMLDPEGSAGYNNKALVYKRLGEYSKEESLYRVALALRPDDDIALNNLAVNLAHQGRFAEALEIMDQLQKIVPDDPYADLHRSKIHAEMGNTDAALKHLELALQGMARLDTLHHIEFRQDIRVDPSFRQLRRNARFKAILVRYYGADTPLRDG